jgi:hypothetical protein
VDAFTNGANQQSAQGLGDLVIENYKRQLSDLMHVCMVLEARIQLAERRIAELTPPPPSDGR